MTVVLSIVLTSDVIIAFCIVLINIIKSHKTQRTLKTLMKSGVKHALITNDQILF